VEAGDTRDDWVRGLRHEVTIVLGRFLTEHLIRVYAAFDGDLTAAIVTVRRKVRLLIRKGWVRRNRRAWG
jgi:hypothetical protein